MITYSELEKSVEDIVRKLEEFCTKNKLSAKNFLALRGMIYGAAERGAEAQELHKYNAIHQFDAKVPIDPNMCVKEAHPLTDTDTSILACVMAGHPLAER